MYERILAEVHHQGSLDRLNASLIILQKIIKNERAERLKLDEEEMGIISSIKESKSKDKPNVSAMPSMTNMQSGEKAELWSQIMEFKKEEQLLRSSIDLPSGKKKGKRSQTMEHLAEQARVIDYSQLEQFVDQTNHENQTDRSGIQSNSQLP